MTPPLFDDRTSTPEPSFDDFRGDPDWLLARAVYTYPDADTPTERLAIRFDAVREMHGIESRYERLARMPRP